MSDYLVHETAYRTKAIVDRRAKQKILLLGVGALGSWLLDLLARQGYKSLTVLDKDRVEAANYGTQNYGPEDAGRMKSSQSAMKIFRRLKVKVEEMSIELTATTIKKLKGYDLIVDLFDNAESRMLVRAACEQMKTPCLHIGLSADGFAEIEWNENYRAHPVPKQDGPCEYPLAANLVHLAVGFGSEVINKFVDSGVKQSVHFTLKDMHTDVMKR